MTGDQPKVPRFSIERGHSIHLGGPWYIGALPDSGRIRYHRDHGTGTHEVPPSEVPAKVRARAERLAVQRDIDTLSRAALRPADRDNITATVEAVAAYERLHGRLY